MYADTYPPGAIFPGHTGTDIYRRTYMKPSTDVVENRRTFVNSLRTNELGLNQTTDGSLVTKEGAVCALGYGCRLFEVDLTNYPQVERGIDGPYDKIGQILGIGDSEGEYVNTDTFEYVWRLNDGGMHNFKYIAEDLETAWGLD